MTLSMIQLDGMSSRAEMMWTVMIDSTATKHTYMYLQSYDTGYTVGLRRCRCLDPAHVRKRLSDRSLILVLNGVSVELLKAVKDVVVQAFCHTNTDTGEIVGKVFQTTAFTG